jgi:ribonucleoside-diphosphate reductase alpha chain
MLTGQCLEITLPTKPVLLKDDSGEVALCTLGAINLGELTDLSEMEELTDLLVRGLDALLTYQDYPNREAKRATLERRPLGIGVINFAYYLAKNGKKYSDGSSLELTHQTFEALQYYALKASANLAKEYSACPAYKDTTYYKGSLPIDTYKKAVDEIVNTPLLLDWTSLRADIDTYGLRNSTLTAMMPSETSSQIANATNGIDPPRGLVTIKSSKDGILKQVVPDIENVKYELLWDMPDNDGYLKLMAVIQKFTDQSISTNTSYDPTKFEGSRVPMSVMLGDLLKAYKYGLKTLYYHNTRDGADDTQEDIVEEESGCAGGACSI